jgi:hypothetical protein
MPKETYHSENDGRDSETAPFWSSAIALYAGVALMIIGALLMFLLDGTFRFILGGALIVLGALSPIVTFFIFAKKS